MRRGCLRASARGGSHVPAASAAEVAANHFRIGANLRGRTLGDLAPEVHDADALRDAFEQLEVVLDHENRASLAGLDDALQQPRRLRFRQPGERLVEKQQLWIGDERARDVEQLLMTVRQVGRGGVAFRPQVQFAQQQLGPFARAPFLLACRRSVKGAFESRRHFGVQAHQQIFQHAERRKHLSLLKAARDAVTHHFVPCEAEHVDAVRYRRDAAERVDQRRLAGTVRTDEREDAGVGQIEIQLVNGREAAEANGDVAHRKHQAASSAGTLCGSSGTTSGLPPPKRNNPLSPAGKKSTTSTMTPPRIASESPLTVEAATRSASTTIAPPMAPGIEPIPPMTTIAKNSSVWSMPKSSGATKPARNAYSPPARPAKNALQTNAITLVRAIGMPIAAAATSLSRMAEKDRPMRVRVRFQTSTTTIASMPSAI